MSRTFRRVAQERGAAFVFVLLIMLGLLMLAHGALVAAISERAGSDAAVRELEARAASGLGLLGALATPPGGWLDTVSIGGAVSTDLGMAGRVAVTGSLLRLGREAWLAEGFGRLGIATLRSARLAWAPDPVGRISALSGIVTVVAGAPVTLAGPVDATSPAAVEDPMEAGDCDPWRPALEAHFDTTGLAPVSVTIDSTAATALGLLDFATLSAAPATVSGFGTPTPSDLSGSCLVDVAWNWGDPEQPWRPCGGHLAWRSAPSDLVVAGGVGQGLLVVDGDLTLDAGSRFYGLVVATGTLRLRAGSALVGMAIASGGVETAPGTELTASACWAVRALAAQQELRRLRMVGVGGTLGPL